MLAVYFVGLPVSLETNAQLMALIPMKLYAQYVYSFLIILNQTTISESSHNRFSALFWLESLFCTAKWLKTPLCSGTVFLPKMNIYVYRYFITIPTPLEKDVLSYADPACETRGLI